ncbi:MAG: glycosyltransferase family 39 protein [Granulosicoccus sp.]
MSKNKKSNHVLTIIVLIAISALFRLMMIGSQSLWLDEGISLAMTDSKTIQGTLEAIWSVPGGDKYQPIYFVLLALWRALMGDNQVTLQLLSVIFGALTPALLYMSIKPLFGYRHALLSALFFVCSAFCVAYSQEVRPYSYLLFLATFQFLLFSPALNGHSSSWQRVVGFSIVTFLCCISSVFLLLFSAVIAMAFLISYRDIKLWLHWWGPASLAALPAVLYYGYTPAAVDLTIDATNTTNFEVWQNTIFALYGHLAGHTYGPPVSALRTSDSVFTEISNYYLELTALVLVCGFLAISASRTIADSFFNKRQASLHIFFVCITVLSLAMALTIALITSINWMSRHSFYLMLPFAVLVPMGIFRYQRAESGHGWIQSPSSSPVAVFAGLLLINVSANSNYYFDTEHWRDDYRSAASYLNVQVEEGDESIMLWGEPYLLAYYGHADIEGLRILEDAELILEKIATAVEEKNHVYISINRVPSWQRYSENLHRLILESYELVPVAEFNSFTNFEIKQKPLLSAPS